ncbi:MAG: calcium-binding protein [Nitrospira sp.]|nr:calcium-binding protein [Nitrospira sp.]
MISETQAQTFLAASSLAYQPAGPSPGSGYQFLRAFPDAGTGFLALVYRNLDTNKCIVAFTGTQPSFQDAYSDLNLGWPQWAANKGPLFDFLAELRSNGNLNQVDFTGHSLGGALAQYAAYDYSNETNHAPLTLTTFNAFGGVQGIVQNLAPGQGYDSARLAGIEVNHFRAAGDMVSRLGEGHVGGNVRVIDFSTPDFIAAHRLETSFLNPTNAGYQLTVLPFATPNYLHVSTGQQLGAALGNLFNDGTYNEFEAALRTTGALLLVLQLAPTNEIDQVMDAMFPQYAHVNWNTVRSILPVSGGAVALGGAGLIFAAGVYEGLQGAAEQLGEVKAVLSRILGENFASLNNLPTGQATLRMSVYLAATSGIGLVGSALGQALSGLIIDYAQLTTHLLSDADWLTNSMNYLRAQANAAGQNAADFSARLASGIYQEAGALAGAATDFLTNTTTVLGIFLHDTAQGIGNAVLDLLHDVPDTLFDLGRSLSFAELNPFTNAYAQALSDPRLDSALRTALEEAQAIVQQAGQTVVIQTGVGPNPFHTPGFVPGGASNATVEENLGEVFRLSLPFAAGTGGQRVVVRLQGSQADQLSVATDDGAQTIGADGRFQVIVPEGADQILFTLVASDEVSADATVTLSATLVDTNGDATHTTQIESVVSMKPFAGNTDTRYQIYEENWEGVTDGVAMGVAGLFLAGSPDGTIEITGAYHQHLTGGEGRDAVIFDHLAHGDDVFVGNGGNDYLVGGRGHDALYGGDDNDTLHGDYFLDDEPETPWTYPIPDPRGARDGRDYLDGGNGNDLLGGGGNADRLLGGAGNDVLWGDVYTTGKIVQRNPDGSYVTQYATGVLHPGDDVLEGGAGNDALSGDSGDDFLDGGEGDDVLIGDTEQGLNLIYPTTPGNDFLTGGAGNDQLDGNAGDDVLLGGSGNDLLSGDDDGIDPSQEGDDWLEGGDGDDVLFARGGDDTLLGGAGVDALYGGVGNDSLVGGEGNDVGFGGTGDDEIVAGKGDDQFDGESGNDVVFGDEGSDVLIGGDGLDELDGGEGDDLVSGGADADTIFGGEGNDELQGGLGDDVLAGDAGDDRIFGEEDNDQIFGGDGNDGLRGDDGDDLIDGGAGDDILVGDADGQIGGSGGNDTLAGGSGNDTLVGGGGQDTYLYDLGDGFDVIEEAAGEGNRLVFGAGISSNAIIAAVGPNDSLVIRTGNGEDAVQIQNFGTNNLNGAHPIDSVEFSDGSILTYSQLAANGLSISGGLGNDQLTGTSQGERIFGGAGNDVVNAGAGNDVLMGAAGNDTLFGEAGQDTYIFAKGGGFDTIQDTSEEGNRLVFGSGISQANLSLSFKQVTIPGGGGEEEGDPGTAINYLVLRPGGAGDAVEIQWFDPGNQLASLGVDQFVFANGTMLTSSQLLANGLELVGTAGFDTLDGQEIYRTIRGLAGDDLLIGGTIGNVIDGGDGRDVLLGNGGLDQISGGSGDDVMRGGDGNDVLNGDAGNDSLEGEAGDDVLIGGVGDDQLLGGDGSDTYRFNIGDGLDSVFDSGSDADTDTVVFGSGITSNSVSLSSQFGQIVITVGGGSDGIQSGSAFDVFGSQTIEQFQFADGTVLSFADLVARGFDIDGTEFDDFLSGTDLVDRFRGGLGNDRFEGGEGNDSYFFNLGDGVDTIIDSASAEAGNEVVFGTGITSTDLRLNLTSDQSHPNQSDLLIRVGTSGDAIQLDTFEQKNVLGLRTVESFRFSGGSVLTYEQLLAGGFDLTGTDGDDQITGTNTVDRVVAGDGADVVRSGLGDDTLDGGLGTDRLIGGQGNDSYLFGPGAGQDTIVEFQGSLDVIRMAPEVAPSDVVVTRNNHDLVLSLSGGADRLTLSLYFLAPPFQIELVQFADGTVWDQAFIENLTRSVITGTEGPDSLVGTSDHDRLVGLAGDDQLIGLAGNDLLDGGTGADQLTGGFGDDEYIVDDPGDAVTELADEGIDTVKSSVTRTLETDVENLTLTGSAAIHGTGNALDNVLIGNSGANVLTGGLGNDTYVVGAADTVVELTGEGTDAVQTSISATLGANVENLSLTGSASLIGVGNELDNVLKADGSISVLAGGDGNDTYVIGPNGDDDILVETTTGGIDRVIAGHDYRLPVNIENLTLLDPRVPDFASFSLILYASFEQSVAGYGNNLANTLIGGRANNMLDGGLGADTLIGGDGNDTYVVDHVGDMVIEEANEGVDTVQSTVSYSLSVNVENLTLSGTISINGIGNMLDNDVRGNDASNVVDGWSGNDALFGFGGSDTYLFGLGSGRDTVFDSEAAGEIDTIQFDSTVAAEAVEVYRNGFNLELAISGTTDELTLLSFFGSPEYDQKQVRFADGTLWSSAELGARALIGNVVTGSFESETILGSDGHDVLIGSGGNDVLMGGRGKDTLYGDLTFQPLSGQQVIGDDRLIGGAGDDSLFDFRGNNLFDGGAGDDTLILGTGVDRVLFGRGAGVDHVTLDNNRNDIDLIELAAEIAPADVAMTWRSPSVADIIISDSGDRLTVVLSTDWFAVGPETTQAIVRFADGTQWNLVWSSSNVDILTATSSDDVLAASFPATLAGLDGDDTYLLGSSGIPGNYEVIEAPGEGIDTVQSAYDYTLPANVENLFLTDFIADNGVGNELDNLIVGNTRDNILDGGAGNDVLVGGIFRELEGPPYIEGTGSDILIGGEGDDILMEDAGNLSFVGGIPFLGGGLDRRDAVPREADDLLIGGLGNDTYIVHDQEQGAVELENEGTDTVKSTVSYVLGEHLENLELISPPAISDEEENRMPPSPLNGTGNELDNVLIGAEDANVLSGLTGHDTLVGGLGNDMLRGGAGHDTYLFNLGDGIDTIEDVAAVGEGNRIQFGVGISRNDLTVAHDEVARTLTIQVGTGGTDRLVLNGFDLTGVNGTSVVETLAFSDGSTASLAGFFGPTITEGNDTITTGTGDDVIDALGGNDIVDTGAGDDTIAGGTGDDTLTGGPGDDTYVYNPGDGVDTINDTSLPSGTNTLEFGAGIDPTDLSLDLGSLLMRIGTGGDALHLSYFDPNNVLGPRTIETFRFVDGTVLSYDELVQRGFDLTGTDGNDSITGTNVVDRITGLAGDDLLIGGRGNDSLTGGLGSDTYIFNIGDGSDTVDDTALLGAGNRIRFGAGISQNDLIFMQDEAARTLTIYVGIDGTDRLVLADFDPRGTNGSLVVSALEFADGNVMNLIDLYPPNHAPTVTVPVADQTAAEDSPFVFTVPSTTFTDPDQIHGDELSYEATLATGSPLPAWLGFDPITRTFSGTPGAGDAGVLQLAVTATDQGHLSTTEFFTLSISGPLPQTLVGTLENDVLTSGRSDDTLRGLAGSDQLNGGQGDDLLDGGAGNDTMYGGHGNDTYVVDATGDVVSELVDEGTDTVQTSLLTYTVGPNVENLILTGTGPSMGTGNTLSNQLAGNSEANLLDGKAGADTMVGGAGNDLYIVDQAGDVVTEAANEGVDTVASSVTYGLGVNVEHLVLTGSAAINGIGNDLDNRLTGNSAANVLTGLLGNDTYVIGVDDTVIEEVNSGTDTVVSSITHTLADNVENLTLVGFTAISGTGNERANVLNGLLSLAGNTLTGGGGNDTYIIGSGDTVVEVADGGTDEVQTGLTHTLGANVENLTLTGISAVNGTGNSLNNMLTGNGANNVLNGGNGNDILSGELGNDVLIGGTGNDTFLFSRGEGQDVVRDNSGPADQILYDTGINPLDLVISRQANDLRLAIHGSTDTVTIQNWYTSTANRTETIQTGNGEILLSTQVDQLIQAMAGFTRQTGLTWDQAIDQQPLDVQAVLAASWQ